jgi:DNA-binding transcriptional regulator YdaS (Cro superfamily)
MITKTILIRQLGSAAALAKAAQVTRQAVFQWPDKVPVERCRAIEAATEGKVTVHDLRPDIFGPAPGVPPELPALPTNREARAA